MKSAASRQDASTLPQSWLSEALALLESNRGFVIATVVDPKEHPLLGRHFLIDPACPSEDMDPVFAVSDQSACAKTIEAVGTKHGARLQSFEFLSQMVGVANATAQVFFAYCGPPPEGWIFGAGHIARALAPVLAALGWRVVVCDDRSEYVTAKRFPDAVQCRVEDFEVSARACAQRSHAWAVLVTRGHQHDQRILDELKANPPQYIGVIGSKRRVATVRRRLAAQELPPAFLDALHAPIGLPIGAESPMEIAISIAAEMVAVRRGWQRDTESINLLPPRPGETVPADTAGWLELWRKVACIVASGRPAVLATVVDRRGSVPRGLGAQMAIFADGSTADTIGGGCGEGLVLRAAREMFASHDPARLVEVDLTGDDASETTDICGGRYSVFLELLG